MKGRIICRSCILPECSHPNSYAFLRAPSPLRHPSLEMLAGVNSTILQLCRISLGHLSMNMEGQSEGLVHASTAVVRLSVLYWSLNEHWATTAPEEPNQTIGSCNERVVQHLRTSGNGGVRESARSTTQARSPGVLAAMLAGAFFPEWPSRAGTDPLNVMLRSCMPLPLLSRVAICRALVHAVEPAVLLSRPCPDGGRGGNFSCSWILPAIIRWCEVESQVQLRFNSLQARTNTAASTFHIQ